MRLIWHNLCGTRICGSIKSMDDLERKEPPVASKYIIKFKSGLTIPDNETIARFDEAKPRDLLYDDIAEAFMYGDEEFEVRCGHYIYEANNS